MKKRVGSAVQKLQGDVSAHISQHRVVTHPKGVLTVVPAGIPRVHGSHGASIRGDKRGKRKDTMTIVAPARCKGRDDGMAQPWRHALAFATVVQRVFLERLRQPIACRSADRCNAEIRPDSSAKPRGALL